MKDFLKIVLGNQTGVVFIAFVFFALLGAAVSLLIQANNRDPLSKNSDVQFSWKYLLNNNWKRILISLSLIYIFLRFLPELTGLQLTNFYALAIGVINDKLAQYLKDKTNILGQKK